MASNRDLPHDAASVAKLRAHLQSRGVPAGLLNTALANKGAGHSRREICTQLTAWLRTRPKG